MKNTKFLLLLLVVILISITVAFFFRTPKLEKYKVKKKKMVHSVYAWGYIDSSDSVSIKPEVSGYVEKIFVKENDEVKKGQLLATIVNNTLRENLREIEAQIASTKDKLSSDSDYKKELLHSIDIKKSLLENAEKKYQRRRLLFQEGLIPKESFEDALREYEIAKKDYERQINFYNDSIKTLTYQLESLQAKRKAIKEEINKHYIKSPIDGKVLRKFVNEGDYVNNMQQNNVLFSVGNDKKLETILFVDEEYIPRIKEGMKVYVTLDSYPEEVFEGEIKTIESQSDRTTRTVKVKANVDYKKPIFFGLTVEANIIINEVEGIFIPQSAYKDGYVEVWEGGKRKKKKIKVSPEKYNGYLLVLDGLTEGQEIIQ